MFNKLIAPKLQSLVALDVFFQKDVMKLKDFISWRSLLESSYNKSKDFAPNKTLKLKKTKHPAF